MSQKRKRAEQQAEEEGDDDEKPKSIYHPNILTKTGFAEGCERHHITRKDAALRGRCNELVLDEIQKVVDAALIIADGRGEKILTLEHLKAAAGSVKTIPAVLL